MEYCPYCQLPLEAPVAQCPSCYADLSSTGASPPPPAPPQRSSGTIVESVSNIRDMVNQERSGGTVVEKKSSPPPAPPKPSKQTPPDDGTVLFRPLRRVPTIKICVLDDGQRDKGEWLRIRQPAFVIGRSEGNLVLPHDADISGRHLEIGYKVVDGQFQFYLKDLGSTNGSFIRVSRLVLQKNQEILIGSRRYRFEPGSMDASTAPTQAAEASTRGWQAVNPNELQTLYPALVEITPQGTGRRLEIKQDSQTLGRDPQQSFLSITDDPFVSPVHAEIKKDQKGRWMVENKKSQNGLWLRFAEVPISSDGEIQLGEQRFLIRFPS